MIIIYFIKYYILNLLIVCSVLFSTLLAGSPYKTLCGRAWKWHKQGIEFPVRWLDKLFSPGHCERSYVREPHQGSALTRARQQIKYQNR